MIQGCEWDFEKRAEIIIKKKIQSNRSMAGGVGEGGEAEIVNFRKTKKRTSHTPAFETDCGNKMARP